MVFTGTVLPPPSPTNHQLVSTPVSNPPLGTRLPFTGVESSIVVGKVSLTATPSDVTVCCALFVMYKPRKRYLWSAAIAGFLVIVNCRVSEAEVTSKTARSVQYRLASRSFNVTAVESAPPTDD